MTGVIEWMDELVKETGGREFSKIKMPHFCDRSLSLDAELDFGDEAVRLLQIVTAKKILPA